jgi:hypothetical protein
MLPLGSGPGLDSFHDDGGEVVVPEDDAHGFTRLLLAWVLCVGQSSCETVGASLDVGLGIPSPEDLAVKPLFALHALSSARGCSENWHR